MAAINANLPETLKIRTVDGQVLEVTGKLINESHVIKKLYESKKNTEITVPVKYSELKISMDVLDLCNLETPHALSTRKSDRTMFVEANRPVMEFLKPLGQDDYSAIFNVGGCLEIQRLLDLMICYFLLLAEGKTTKELRQMFGFRDDYTEEEDAEIRKAHETNA